MKKLLLLISLIPLFLFSQVGDCPGLCIISNGTYSTSSSLVPELNALNRGCLTAGEANASFWFQVCFSSSGNFQFYIDPSGNRNDFDFAVWSGTACTPIAAPIRCSYAAVSPGGPCATCDYTGLGNGATDFSENATGDGWVAPLNVTAGQCLTININNYGAGSNSFSLFFNGTTANMNCISLPIELISFSLQFEHDGVFLKWITASELNNDLFRLERTQDFVSWDNVTEIKSKGNSVFRQEYEYLDAPLFPGKYYYRLSQVELNGEIHYYTTLDIDVLDRTNCEYEYFNLNGVKVNFEEAEAGIYLRRCKNNFVKVIKY